LLARYCNKRREGAHHCETKTDKHVHTPKAKRAAEPGRREKRRNNKKHIEKTGRRIIQKKETKKKKIQCGFAQFQHYINCVL